MTVAPLHNPKVGQVLEDRYELLEIIGEGGMGTVFRAHQLGVGRDVAVKVLRPALARADEHVVRLFFREARAVSRLTHPNTITLHDFGRTRDGLLFIATELLGGRPMSALLRTGPLPVETAAHIVLQVCQSLDEAHGQGIVHRDVKPDNVMVQRKAWDPHFVKVLDFGIAKVVGYGIESANTGLRFGTPLYMSPEQILGNPSDARTDLYTMGVLLFECLTGMPPFVGKTPVEICLQHLDGPVPRLSNWHSPWSYPQRLERLVSAMLAKDPAARPQSAAEVQRELTAVLESERAEGATAVSPAPDPEEAGRPPRPHADPDSIRRLASTQSIHLPGEVQARITDRLKRREPREDAETRALPRESDGLGRLDPRDQITLLTPATDLREAKTTAVPVATPPPPPDQRRRTMRLEEKAASPPAAPPVALGHRLQLAVLVFAALAVLFAVVYLIAS